MRSKLFPAPLLLAAVLLATPACDGDGGDGGAPDATADTTAPTPDVDAVSPDAGGDPCVGQPQLTPCDDGNACTENDRCLDGACVGAVSCDDDNPCTDDACVDQVCTSTPNDAGCDDGNPCTAQDHCVAGACGGGQPLDDIVCDDDDICTIDDTCTGGVCLGAANNCNDLNNCTADSCDPTHPDAEPGTGCLHVPMETDCDDVNPCTDNDTCVGGVCVGEVTVGAPCQDGDLCTSNELCQADGSCLGEVTMVCDDDNTCTADSCEAEVGCVYQPLPGDLCDDGINCTIDDQCRHDGSCAGLDKPCQPDDACIIGTCQEATGSCVEVAVDCDDANVCTDDGCNPASGCWHEDNDDPCNDGSVCTHNDTCVDGDCEGLSEVVCDPSADTDCTKNVCDPFTGDCGMQAVTGVACDDGDLCTHSDACAAGECTGIGVVCDDDDPCTLDVCDPASGECEHSENPDGCGGLAVDRANQYRSALGLPLIDHDNAIENAAQAHCDYYVDNYNTVYQGPMAISPHSEADGYEGFTGTSPGDRMEAAGYAFSGMWLSSEVMAFVAGPKNAVDSWVSTVYHRIPFVVAQYQESGYGMAQKGFTKCDTMDFAGTGTAGSGVKNTIFPLPLNGMPNVPTYWDGLESPTPPLPIGKTYPSGPILTLTFGAASPWPTVKITGSELLDDLEAPVEHVAYDPTSDYNLCCGVVSMYAVNPLDPYTTYTATIDYTWDGTPGTYSWTFTTGDGGSQAFDP